MLGGHERPHGTDVVLRIVIDRERCAGTGMCESFAPEVFELGIDGFVTLLDDEPAVALHEQVRAAADACPVEAIGIVE